MATMKTGRTTSITTPPPTTSDYKKYQSDSTNYEKLIKEFKELPNKNKYFGEGGFGKLRKLNPADQKKVYALQDKFSPNQLKDSITHVGSYETDAQFMERFTNMTDPTSDNWTSGSGRPGAILKKPVKPKQVIDPSKTKKSVKAKVVAVTPKETIAKTTVVTTPKEDMTLSKMPLKKVGLIKTEKKELQGKLEKRPEYTQISSTRKNILPTKGGRYNIHTPIGAKIVQALTGYNKKGGYQDGEGRIFGDRFRSTDPDRSYNTIQTDEKGRAIFKGAEGFKDLREQKKYNKEFDKYQEKQDQMNAFASMFNNAANRNTIASQTSKLKK
jgi:hypothetical protein